jgi:hypothetical protein
MEALIFNLFNGGKIRIYIPDNNLIRVYTYIYTTIYIYIYKSRIKQNRGIPVPRLPPEGTWEMGGHAGGSVMSMSYDTGGGGPGRVRRQDER